MATTRKSGCKINLLLNILGKREDGFHELETILQPVALFDYLEISRSGNGVSLTSSDPNLKCDESNLIVRAAHAFCSVANLSDGIKIDLEKRIPMEAGLGGGSANAATTLLGLNELFDHLLPTSKLVEIAATLGSDVPFFLQPNPALGTGRGEFIEPLNPFERIQDLSLLLIRPEFGISTGWSYSSLARYPESLNGHPGRANQLIDALGDASSDWGSVLYNSLEAPAFDKFPVLQLYTEYLLENNAVASLMSGSGSTVFAYFEQPDPAELAMERFKRKFGGAGWSIIV